MKENSKKPKIVALIPVRGGSKSIKLKNIKEMNGRPLVYWVMDAALQCDWIDEVYIATDHVEIRNAVLDYDKRDKRKLKCIDRNPENATDEASTESVMVEFVNKIPSDIMVLIQATNPLLKSDHLTEALNVFLSNGLDSLLSVVRQKRFIWKINNEGLVEPVNYSPEKRPRRQDYEGFLVENGAFYITKTDQFIRTGVRISGNIGYYIMPEESYYEIDEPQDWMIVEQLLKQSQFDSLLNKKIKNIKLLATDCDGVLTDAGMYYSADGDYLKKFNTKDGKGLSMLMDKGIIVAIITGENSEIVKRRAEKLGIKDVYLGCENKVAAMEELLLKYNLSFEEIAYIGDDINDLELLKKAGVSFSVSDATDIVKQTVDYVTKNKGGYGAVREVADLILSIQDVI